jgi:hypothetical protein
MEPIEPYAAGLRNLAAEFARLATLPTELVLVELGKLINFTNDSGILSQIRRIRQDAAKSLVKLHGSQQAAAEAAGITQPAIARMVKGVSRPHP